MTGLFVLDEQHEPAAHEKATGKKDVTTDVQEYLNGLNDLDRETVACLDHRTSPPRVSCPRAGSGGPSARSAIS
jgi:hypothetical protein